MSLFRGTAEFYRQFRSGVPAEVAALLDPRRTRPPAPEVARHRHGHRVRRRGVAGRRRRGDRHRCRRRPARGRPQQREAPTGPADRVRPGPRGGVRATYRLDRRPGDDLSHLPLARSTTGAGRSSTRQSPPTAWWRFSATTASGPTTPAGRARLTMILAEFLGEARRAGSGTYQRPTPYTDDLEGSAFTAWEQLKVPLRRERSLDSVIGYLHSTSFGGAAPVRRPPRGVRRRSPRAPAGLRGGRRLRRRERVRHPPRAASRVAGRRQATVRVSRPRPRSPRSGRCG